MIFDTIRGGSEKTLKFVLIQYDEISIFFDEDIDKFIITRRRYVVRAEECQGSLADALCDGPAFMGGATWTGGPFRAALYLVEPDTVLNVSGTATVAPIPGGCFKSTQRVGWQAKGWFQSIRIANAMCDTGFLAVECPRGPPQNDFYAQCVPSIPAAELKVTGAPGGSAGRWSSLFSLLGVSGGWSFFFGSNALRKLKREVKRFK